MALPDSFCNEFLSALEKIYPALPTQIIHRDPNPGNIIINGDSFGFTNFDLAERNVRIYDTCYAAAAILSETVNGTDETRFIKWIELYKNMMAGYDAAAKLSEEEKPAVPYIIMASQFVCCAWFSEEEKYQEQYRNSVIMTKLLIDNFNKLFID